MRGAALTEQAKKNESSDSQKKLISSLMRGDCYPHKTNDIRVVETHISWVILTGDYAYKIKKSVDFGFLNFSTLASRQYYCNEELRLNNRFSHNIYLDVIPISGSPDKPVLAPGKDVFEYALRMKQFPSDGLFSDLARKGKLEEPILRQLASNIAEFHKNALVYFGDKDEHVKSVCFSAMQNFQQIDKQKNKTKLEIHTLHYLRCWTQSQLKVLTPIFHERYKNKKVRECHGDLHLDNITLIDEKPVLFDCIEFNPVFRTIDTISELAYLLMDLEHRNCYSEANILLNQYLSDTGDYAGLALLNFYKIYRSMVRAKVVRLRMAQKQETKDVKLSSEYISYLHLADAYTETPEKQLIITHGVSASGKSYHSRKLCQKIGAIHLRSDIERKRVFGLHEKDRSDSALGAGIYSNEISEAIYRKLYAQAKQVLDSGYSVVVDATFLKRVWREKFLGLAKTCGVPFKILHCEASAEKLSQRLQERKNNKHSVSEADINVLRKQQSEIEMLTRNEREYLEETRISSVL